MLDSSSKGIPIGAQRTAGASTLSAACERMQFGAFYRAYFCWKDGDVSAAKFKSFPPTESLPLKSVLHCLDNFKALEEGTSLSDICSFDIPFVKNEPQRKLLCHQMAPLTDGWIKTPNDYIYRTAQLVRNIEKFWSTNSGKFIRKKTIKELNVSDNALCIINHNPIFRLFVRGAMWNWRAMNHYLASLFNTVQFIPDRTHYFVFPLSDKIFARGKFAQISNKISTSSIADRSSFQYCLFAQLYNFMNVNCTLPNPFKDIPVEFRKKIVLVFEHAGHYLFWPLNVLEDLNIHNKIFTRIFNHFNGFILRGIAEKVAKANELEKLSTEQELQKTNDVELTIIKNYSQITKVPVRELMTEDQDSTVSDDNDYISAQDANELERLTRAVKSVPLIMGDSPTILDVSDVQEIIKGGENDDIEPTVAGTNGSWISGDAADTDKGVDSVADGSDSEAGPAALSDGNIPGEAYFYTEAELSTVSLPGAINKPFETGAQVAETGKAYLDSIDEAAAIRIKQDTTLTSAQKERALRMSQSYKDVMLGNKTIEQLLTEPVSPKLDEEDITILPDDKLPDRSMCKSSIVNLDQEYMTKMFPRHLAGTIASMASQGMYLQDVEKHITNTELTQAQEYVVRYKTVNGKTHTSRFSFPIIRPDGTFLLNGVRSTMSKQLTTRPIAKLTATRVSLASNYNKTIVEKLSTANHDYQKYFMSTITDIQKERPGTITNLEFGIRMIPGTELCGYEYWQIAQKIHSFVLHHHNKKATSYFYFGEKKGRADDPVFKAAKITDSEWKEIEKYEEKNHSNFIGVKRGTAEYTPAFYYMDVGSLLHIVGTHQGKPFDLTGPLLMLLCNASDYRLDKGLSEWTDIKILDAKFPVGFLLCYRFGLLNVLRRLRVKYRLEPARARHHSDYTGEIIIPFSDQRLVIPRYPLKTSLIVQGLRMFNTKQGALEDYDHKDIYYQLLLDKRMGAGRTNYLIGIDDTFDGFVDILTYERLKQMGEPTDFGGLLVRATEMLSTPYHRESTEMANHCLRSYERMVGILYNEMSAQMRVYKKQRGPMATFSIKPNAVMQRIVQDQTAMPVEDINPMHDLKTTTKLSYLGMGGRSADSITIDDRRFPDDGIGVLSESTPSAGNVGVVVQSTIDPRIDNLSGLIDTKEDFSKLEPTQVLSATALFLPAVTQDDGKRISMASNFISHTVPTKEGEVLRVRTGFETMVAHRCNDIYAYTAKEDGKVLDVNDKLKMVKIQYKSGRIESFSSDTQYGQCSDMLVEQQQVVTVKKGDTFKKDEVLRYNPQFFVPDPDMPRQVSMVHGVTAKVAILENSLTFEDSNAISAEFAERLGIAPVVDRLITVPAKAVVHEYLKVGDEVEINTPLLVFERDDATDLAGVGVDDSALLYLENLNRSAPKAKNTGKIVDIKVLYAGNLQDMHPSMAKMVSNYTATKKAIGNYVQGSENQYLFSGDSKVPEGSKYKGITLDNETIVLQYFIQDTYDQGSGDKMVIGPSLKTVTCLVLSKAPVTERGQKVDALFSATSIGHRIVNSPFLVGIAEANMEALEDDVIAEYFGIKKGATEALDWKDVDLTFRPITRNDLKNKDTAKLLDEMSMEFFGTPSTEEQWLYTKEGHQTFLFFRNDADGEQVVTGFATISLNKTGQAKNRVAFIRYFDIREGFRGTGYGSQYFPMLLKWLKNEGATAVRLAHETDNLPAKRLYTRHGLKPVSYWYDVRPLKLKNTDELPPGFEFLGMSYHLSPKEIKTLNEFYQQFKSDLPPTWAWNEAPINWATTGVLYKKDPGGNLVACAGLRISGETEPYYGELWYPVAKTHADFLELLKVYRSIKYLRNSDELYLMCGVDHRYLSDIKKVSTLASTILGKKL